ncbi:phosphatase PAP2 family protein [Chitinophaga sp.]|uniref:phosphatase PAP2 family protein n=1 Tax=Chitinophaga sp. TaxID=1869181 RepID=UPI0031CDEE3A
MRFYGLQLLLLLVATECSYGQTIAPVKEDTSDKGSLYGQTDTSYKVRAMGGSYGQTITPVKEDTSALGGSYGQTTASYKVNPVPVLASAIMIGYGAATFHVRPLHDLDLSTRHEIREDNSRFHTSIDNYLQYSPIFGVYALNAMGIHGAHNFKDRTIILGISSLLVTGTVTGLKNLTHRERPDGSAANSFPSGHTATAFMSAEFMRMEYKDVSSWYGVGGYIAATATGVLRMYNNRHWLSDVVAGAGVGILSTQAAFWLYPKIEKGLTGKANTSTMVMPTYDAGTRSAGISLVYIH